MENREIKFRAWDGNTMLFSHNNDIIHDFGQLEWFFKKLKGTENLMQFTGHIDKNGKEIYEGDICNSWIGDGLPFVNVVIYKDGAFGYSDGDRFHSFAEHGDISKPIINDWEIIGNIHENPEWL